MRVFVKYDENQVLILLSTIEGILTGEYGVAFQDSVNRDTLLYHWYEKICDACDNSSSLMIPFSDIDTMRNELVNKYACEPKDVNTAFCLTQNMNLYQMDYLDTSLDSDIERIMVYDASNYETPYLTDEFPVFDTINSSLFDKYYVSIEETSGDKFKEMQVILAFNNKDLEKVVSDEIIYDDCKYEPEDVTLHPLNEVFVCRPKPGKNVSEVTKMSDLDFYRVLLVNK